MDKGYQDEEGWGEGHQRVWPVSARGVPGPAASAPTPPVAASSEASASSPAGGFCAGVSVLPSLFPSMSDPRASFSSSDASHRLPVQSPFSPHHLSSVCKLVLVSILVLLISLLYSAYSAYSAPNTAHICSSSSPPSSSPVSSSNNNNPMLVSNLKKPLAGASSTSAATALINALPYSLVKSEHTASLKTEKTSSSPVMRNKSILNGPNTNNRILRHRHLVDLNPVKNINKTVTISSYNILCRHYLWESVYNYLPIEYTSWNYRFDRLNKTFIDLSKLSDVMCFQEMEYKIYKDYWKKIFEDRNYDSIFQKKPKPDYWKKTSTMMDGVSIFYNKDKFELLNYEHINFANHFKHSSIIEQTLDTQTRLNVRNTVAIIAVLRHKFTNEIIFASNTHLYWSPKHDDVKLMQTYLLTNLVKKAVMRFYKISEEELNQRILENKGPNIVMVGDFNSTPDSMVYKFMSKGFINKLNEPSFPQNYGSKVNSLINNNLGKFKSPYKDLYSAGIFKKTTYTPKFKEVIDYMWFADCNKNFKFTKVLGDIDQDYLSDYKGFPNVDFPSDHIAILSQFEFN